MTDQSVRSKQLRFSSLVVFVSDIPKSSRFYSELLNLDVVIETESAALLVGADGNQLYLRGIGERASLAMGGLGPQYMVWSAASEEQFHSCEAILRRQSAHTLVTVEKEFMMAEGRDPDGAPVMVTYPGPQTVSRTEIISRIYGW
jgi:catechol 2,3-dioxygenase-like lactoylglutathione lyase family enzyme